ncbi:N-acetylmuramoyl-L-alanine amidase [Rhizorhabdus dicambivorans]|uniref:N-acetylmuramoyl-L-alanine amidase n=2 Tax=Rhizorhabdus dicambivorans TaxID=1850238 RepID=A0A2A4FVS6_9SPHN|nr:N-acetylmuramoyl-L-alanine amidase [Rhizorhabdus dicambivorans]PCE42271.1 N-acetylmuramoyl-L-alanine amidase [Rhizorhabdus dicambivorans]
MVSAIEIGASSVTMRFDKPVATASAFMLTGPQRIAVDLPGARMGRIAASGGMIASTRHGQYDPNTARVVFELNRSAIVGDASFSADHLSLTLTLKPVTESLFARAVRRGRQLFGLNDKPVDPKAAQRGGITVPLDPPRPLPVPAVTGARGSNRPLVVIDAGHGGHDPGSQSADGRYREKDVALGIAQAIRDELVASGRVRVALTRNTDRFLVLGERREIARRLKADLFISVHADSAENRAARGASIYTLSEVASDRVAAQLAAKENRADILNGVDLGGENNEVSSILLDLAQRETMNISSQFAALLQREMAPTIHFKDDAHRFAGLIVLKAPDVPSVLLETGYISNDDDLALLLSKEYRRNIASGVRRAVEIHFARRLAGE